MNEEEDNSQTIQPDLTPSKRTKSFKLRKQINTTSASTPDTMISIGANPSPSIKKKKVVKVVKAQNKSHISEEKDISHDSNLILECLEDPSLFFKEKDLKTGMYLTPQYSVKQDSQGNIPPYSYVGSLESFKKVSVTPKALQTLSTVPSTQINSSEHRIPTLEVLKRANMMRYIDPTVIVNNKLKRIEEGIARGEMLEKQQIQNMRRGERIILERQKKVLEKYKKTSSQWNRIQEHLSVRTQKSKENLAFNRLFDYRERIESWDVIDRGISNDEKAGDYCWYMSLRAQENTKMPKETYMMIGNPMYPLYTRIQERPKSKAAIIRKPGQTPTSYKTFRDDSYYQTRVFEEMTKSGVDFSLKPEDLDELYVQGVSKLPLEIEAAHTAGLKYVHPELIPEGGPEEIIAIQYDKLIKY
jgi:hypothetical protein